MRLALLATLLSVPLLAQAKWTEASSPHFVVYSEGKPAEVRAVADKLERFDQMMRFLHRLGDPPLSPANRLTVYVVRDTDEVGRLARNTQVAGFYIGRAGGSIAVVPRSSSNSSEFDDGTLFTDRCLFRWIGAGPCQQRS